MSSHDKSLFTCGKETLDNYINKQAELDIKKRLSVVFVISDTTPIFIYSEKASLFLIRHSASFSTFRMLANDEVEKGYLSIPNPIICVKSTH